MLVLCYLRGYDRLGEVLIDSVDELLSSCEVQNSSVSPVHHPANRVVPACGYEIRYEKGCCDCADFESFLDTFL